MFTYRSLFLAAVGIGSLAACGCDEADRPPSSEEVVGEVGDIRQDDATDQADEGTPTDENDDNLDTNDNDGMDDSGSTGDTIDTLAGNGQAGFSGDGGQAAKASIYHPAGVAIDARGNIYIADQHNNRIRRVTPIGIITTIAGNGNVGYNGDNIPAVDASLSYPYGVSVDTLGNIYIAETAGNRIRKVNPFGIITTVAGNGMPGYNGDGCLATDATLSSPTGVVPDGLGNLYIADMANNRIRRINPLGIISTVAGTGEAGFSGDGRLAVNAMLNNPFAVAAEHDGNLYISDMDNNRIRMVTPHGIITTIAGDGREGFSGDDARATAASLSGPRGLEVDQRGNIYIADTGNNRIRRISPFGIISTVAGNGGAGYTGDDVAATEAQLYLPYDVTLAPAGNIYIADFSNQRVREVW